MRTSEPACTFTTHLRHRLSPGETCNDRDHGARLCHPPYTGSVTTAPELLSVVKRMRDADGSVPSHVSLLVAANVLRPNPEDMRAKLDVRIYAPGFFQHVARATRCAGRLAGASGFGSFLSWLSAAPKRPPPAGWGGGRGHAASAPVVAVPAFPRQVGGDAGVGRLRVARRRVFSHTATCNVALVTTPLCQWQPPTPSESAACALLHCASEALSFRGAASTLPSPPWHFCRHR